jgi:predicted Zn-dependent protease
MKPAAAPDPRVEYERMLTEARRAFANGEYGRAAESLRRATALDGERADGQLLYGQAAIALGKLADAAAAIHAGVRRDPNWPAKGLPLREVYGARKADFDHHRRLADEVAAAFPGDAAFQFVRAYIAWFDGDREAARRIFSEIRAHVSDPAVIDRFLAQP